MIRRLLWMCAPAAVIVLLMVWMSVVSACTVVPPTDRPEPEPSPQAAPTPGGAT